MTSLYSINYISSTFLPSTCLLTNIITGWVSEGPEIKNNDPGETLSSRCDQSQSQWVSFYSHPCRIMTAWATPCFGLTPEVPVFISTEPITQKRTKHWAITEKKNKPLSPKWWLSRGNWAFYNWAEHDFHYGSSRCILWCGTAAPSSKCCPAVPALIGAVLDVKTQAYLIYKGHTMGDPCALFCFDCAGVSPQCQFLGVKLLFLLDCITPSTTEADLCIHSPVCGWSKCQVRGADVGWYFMVSEWSWGGERRRAYKLLLLIWSSFFFFFNTLAR